MSDEDVMAAIIEAHDNNDTADVKHYSLVQLNRIKELKTSRIKELTEISDALREILIEDLYYDRDVMTARLIDKIRRLTLKEDV